MGVAVSPGYDRDRMIYLYFTAADDNRVVRARYDGRLGPLDPIVTGIPKAGNHDGGRLAFGPDGFLYIATGEAGRTELSQNRESLGGKILRVRADGSPAPGNPFGTRIWSYGHRNVQGLAWADDGTLFATEFGQDTWDELNVITAGANFGWPEVEGIAERDEFVDPVQQWSPADASPSGMAHVDGTLFVANLRGQVLRAVPVSDPTTSSEHLAGEYGRLRDAVLAPDGGLWILTNNTDGRGDPGPDDDRILAVDVLP
jgi:glucose/arabinose dehydrogenase